MEDCAQNINMQELNQHDTRFSNYPCALYATDVTFQQANRPTGTIEEGKAYYSGKHKLYGLKVEVSVLPVGLAINCTRSYPGSYADIDIFRRNMDFHKKQVLKNDSNIEDSGPLHDKYPDQWAILVDKGYQGLQEVIRAIHPARQTANTRLSNSQIATNQSISSDRIIVENYFGRLTSLWEICSRKFRWSRSLYDDIFQLSLALTNYHIEKAPLRHDDGVFFSKQKNILRTTAEEKIRKRKRIQEKYHDNRRLRINTGHFRSDSSLYHYADE